MYKLRQEQMMAMRDALMVGLPLDKISYFDELFYKGIAFNSNRRKIILPILRRIIGTGECSIPSEVLFNRVIEFISTLNLRTLEIPATLPIDIEAELMAAYAGWIDSFKITELSEQEYEAYKNETWLNSVIIYRPFFNGLVSRIYEMNEWSMNFAAGCFKILKISHNEYGLTIEYQFQNENDAILFKLMFA